jgi:hypothetical protein
MREREKERECCVLIFSTHQINSNMHTTTAAIIIESEREKKEY